MRHSRQVHRRNDSVSYGRDRRAAAAVFPKDRMALLMSARFTSSRHFGNLKTSSLLTPSCKDSKRLVVVIILVVLMQPLSMATGRCLRQTGPQPQADRHFSRERLYL